MSRTLLNCLLCCGALLLCLALADPFVASPFNDDWSYSHVALRLAETGHFHYNGWGSPNVVFQSIWGAFFIRLFGFSFNVLRLSALPFSLGFVVVTYLLAIKLGVRRHLAFCATLCLAASPLFVSSAASFMTEPFACFFGLFCVFAAVSAIDAPSDQVAIRWILLLTLSGIFGGSDRQSVWVASLTLVPYVVWLRRGDKRIVYAAAACYAVCLATLLFVLKNFASQTYAPLQVSRSKLIGLVYQNGILVIHEVESMFLACLLMSLPLLLCFVVRWNKIPRRHVLALAILCLFLFDYLLSGLGFGWGTVPFIGNLMSNRGILAHWMDGLGYRPVLLRHLVTYPMTYLLLFALAAWVYLRRDIFSSRGLKAITPTQGVLWIYLLGYLPLLLPGALVFASFDRYMIPIFPVVLIFIALSAQDLVPRVPRVAWACLAVFAVYGIIITHDYYRSLGARAQAFQLAVAKGVPPNHLSVSFETDGWQALLRTGRTKPTLYLDKVQLDYNKFWFWFYVDDLKPEYVATATAASVAPPSALVQVPFTAWTPPFRRIVSIVPPSGVPKDPDYEGTK